MVLQTSSFSCYMRPHSGPFLSFLAYIEAPSDQFLLIEYGGPLLSVSSLIMLFSLCLFFAYYIWGPKISLFAYYIGAPSSLSSLTLWGPLGSVSSHTIWCPLRSGSSQIVWESPSGQFLCLLYGGPPHVSFFAYYLGAP